MRFPSKKTWILLGLSIVVILISVSPLLKDGFPKNHDSELYMVWLSEFDEGIRDGQFLPRWVPNVWVGYGSPLFNFNQPLFFYLAEMFHLIGFSLVLSVKLTLILATCLAYLFMFVLSKQFFGRHAALLASSIYIMMPYHIGLMYERGAFSEYLAMAFAPLLFFVFYRLGQKISYKYFFWGSITVALLLLSHNISTLFYIPAVFLMVVLFSKKNLKYYLVSFSSIIIGFLLAAFFWIPAFFERHHLKLDNLFSPPYDYHDHFISFRELFFSHYWNSDDMFFQVSFVTSLVMVIGFTLILKNWRTKTRIHSRAVFFFLFLAVVGILFTNSTTLFVWENIDLMKFIQFPSRFLSLTNLATAFLAGILVWPELQKSYRWIYKKIRPKATYGLTGATIVILILLIWFFSPFLKPSGGYLPKKPDQRYAPHYLIHDQLMASNTINTFVYKTAIFPKYNNIDKLEERVDKVVDDINYALWHDLEYRYQKTEILEGQAEIGLVFEKSNQRKLKINASTDVIMIVNTFWFPGWQAKLNGQPVDIIVNDDFGLMEFNIPMGSHELVLEFKNTPIRTASNAISLISIIILFGVGAYAKLRRNKQSESFYHTQR